MPRLLVVVLILTNLGGLGGWAVWPDDHPASRKPIEDPAANGPDGAFHRWQSSQPHHWRYLVTPRR